MEIYNMIKNDLDTSDKEKRLKAYELSESYISLRLYCNFNINIEHFNKDDPFKMDYIHVESNTLIDIKCQKIYLINGINCFYLSRERLNSYFNACNHYPKEDGFTGIIIYHMPGDKSKFISLNDIDFFINQCPNFEKFGYIYIPINNLYDESNLQKYFDSKKNVIELNKMSCKERLISKLNLRKIDYLINNKFAYPCIELNTKLIFFETLTSKFSRYNENEKLSLEQCLIMDYEKYKYLLNLKNKKIWICYLIRDKYDKKNLTYPMLVRELVFIQLDVIEAQNKKGGSTILQKNGKYINFTKLDSIKEINFFENFCGDDKEWKLDF